MTEERYQPEYRRIEHALRARLAELKPGDRLPSDTELCTEFSVSRMTARNAMQRLAEEGLVVRVPGRGSFVSPQPAHRRANRLMTFTEEMRRHGRRPASRLIERCVRGGTASEAADLGQHDGDPVVFLRRIRLADGEAIAFERTVLAGRCASTVMAADLESGSLHAALTAAGFTLRRGTGTISAQAASTEDASMLGIAPGSPMLVERRVILDSHGRRIEATESRYPGERYALDVRFDVEEPGEGDA